MSHQSQWAVVPLLAFSVLAALGGCSSDVVAPEKCKGANCNLPESPSCPDSFPDSGNCSAEGQSCAYDVKDCTLNYICKSGAFALEPSTCIIPCDDLPSWSDVEIYPDGACAKVNDECNAVDLCTWATWRCDADHLWHVVSMQQQASSGGDC
jgi:hypothetical protein